MSVHGSESRSPLQSRPIEVPMSARSLNRPPRKELPGSESRPPLRSRPIEVPMSARSLNRPPRKELHGAESRPIEVPMSARSLNRPPRKELHGAESRPPLQSRPIEVPMSARSLNRPPRKELHGAESRRPLQSRPIEVPMSARSLNRPSNSSQPQTLNSPSNSSQPQTLNRLSNSSQPQTLNRSSSEPRAPIGEREKLLNLLNLFRSRCREQTTASIHRIDLKVYKDLKDEELAFVKHRKKLAMLEGAVPGVEVEDRFNNRVELIIAGLHTLLQTGIYSVKERGSKMARCVVANEGTNDRLEDPDVLFYRGEGGNGGKGSGEVMGKRCNQEMRNGNLGMMVSKDMKYDVRVVRGVKVDGGRKTVYVYDGLYKVVDKKDKMENGFVVFYFEMRRNPGQKRIDWRSIP